MIVPRPLVLLVATVVCAPSILIHLLWRFVTSRRKATFFSAATRVGQSSARPPHIDGAKRVTLETDAGELVHAFVAGDPAAPLMLCLHGFPESAYSWRHVLTAFANTHYVVAIDMPGYGSSSKPQPTWWASDEYALPHVVAGVMAALRALGRERADVLVGHDWGAMIAWCLAGAHPTAVGRLVCLNVPHPAAFRRNMSARQALRSLYIAFFTLPGLPELYLAADDYAFLHGAFMGPRGGVDRRGGEHGMTRADVDQIKWTMSRAGSLTAALNYYRALFSPASLRFQREGMVAGTRRAPLPMPVLQVWGTADAFLGEELTDGTDAYCADFTLVKLPGCSHWVQQDHVPEAVGAMRTWLAARAGK